jgi:hypothetical protein
VSGAAQPTSSSTSTGGGHTCRWSGLWFTMAHAEERHARATVRTLIACPAPNRSSASPTLRSARSLACRGWLFGEPTTPSRPTLDRAHLHRPVAALCIS